MDPLDTLRELARRDTGGDESPEAVALREALLAQGAAALAPLEPLLSDAEQPIELRAQAARVLEDAGEAALAAAVLFYVAHLDDPDTWGRPFALQRMAALGPRALPALESALEPDQAFSVRLGALHAAAMIVGSALVPLLLAVASQDPDERLGQAASEALGRVGGPAARDALETLLGHPSANVRYGAVSGLARLGDPAAGPSLAALLEAEDEAPSEPAVAWWSSAAAGPLALGPHLEAALSQLAGRDFGGDRAAISAWAARQG